LLQNNTHSKNNNHFITRLDLQQNLKELLEPLKDRAVIDGYYLGDAGAHYPPKTAVMEGFCRTLWGVGPLIAGGGDFPNLDVVLSILKNGTNPDSDGYWGVSGNRDQRLVEKASIALTLMIARETFWDPLSPTEKNNMYQWLSVIEKRELPPTNWHFFRIMVCTCFRELGLPVDEKAEQESFDLMDSLYKGDGWYEDGMRGNFDLYNPMGFHFTVSYGLNLQVPKIRRERKTTLNAQNFSPTILQHGLPPAEKQSPTDAVFVTVLEPLRFFPPALLQICPCFPGVR